MNRKSIRLTTTSYAVMSLLALREPGDGASPYELEQLLEQSIENFWPIPHTSFYVEPARLARAGYLSATQEQGGRRRKRYSLTKAGREALRAWAEAPGAPPSQYRDEALLKVFAGADPAAAFAGRLDWHYAKLAELQGYVQSLNEGAEEAQGDGGAKQQDGDRWQGPHATLMSGIAYHGAMIEMLERLLGDAAAQT